MLLQRQHRNDISNVGEVGTGNNGKHCLSLAATPSSHSMIIEGGVKEE